jgi:hypothetical protein
MAAGPQGWRKSEHYSSSDGNQECKAEHPRVLGDVNRKAVARHHRKQEFGSPSRAQNADETSRAGKQHAFGEKLAH